MLPTLTGCLLVTNSMLGLGFQATTLAVHDARLLLAIEDTTTLSYKHSIRSELGDIGEPKNSSSRGLWAHSVMLLDADTERTLQWR